MEGQERPEPGSGRELVAARALFLFLGILALYAPSLRNGWIWDDDDYVTRNEVLRSPGGLADAWLRPTSIPQWYPVVHTTFWIEHALWGLHPAGYHLVNALLHALNAVLLWFLLRRLGVPGAFLGALLFGVHPVQVESVAWVTERKNVLSMAFYLLSLGALLRWMGVAGDPPPEGRRRTGTYLLALGAFVLALLSKTVTATLPAAALVILWWKRGRITRRDVLPLLPFFALGIGLGLTTAWLEREHVGAAGPDWALGPVRRVLLAGRALWFYAGKLLWPADLIFIYPRWTLDPGSLRAWLFPAAAVGVLGWIGARRGTWGRGPLAAGLLYAGTLFPALGFLDVYPFRYSFVADHFQYHASAALLAGAGALLAGVPDRFGAGRGIRHAAIALLAFLAWERQRAYASEETLWRDTARRNPRAWIAWTNLGAAAQRAGRLEESEELTRRALDLAPRNHEAWNNLGNALLARGDRDGAEDAYGRALAIMPGFSMARTNLGKLQRDRGEIEAALENWRRVIAENPGHMAAHVARIETLRDAGRREEAEAAARGAVERWPRDASLRVEHGNLLAAGPEPARAIPELEEAVRLEPESPRARRALGNALAAAGERERGAAVLEETARRFPRSVRVLDDLGVLLRDLGRTEEAEARFREAAALDPPDAGARLHLALLLAADGRRAAAANAARDAAKTAADLGERDLEARARALLRSLEGE